MKEYLDTEVGKINKEIIFLKEENNELRNRIEYLEIKERSCDLIFEGIKESTYAEATSDVGSQDVKLTRKDTVSSVINCCREKLNIEVAPNDINSCYRITRRKNQKCRSVFVSFDSKNLRDRIFQAKKMLKGNKEGIYINEPLTKKNSQIYFECRGLVK